MRSKTKMRPLSRYLKDYKHTQSNCSHCRKVLDRMALVFRGQIINKETIARMDQLVSEQVWQKLQEELIALCRFCSDIYCNTHPKYFDILAFKQYLFENTEMSPSAIRQYVVRLRHLDEILLEKKFLLKSYVILTGVNTLRNSYPMLVRIITVSHCVNMINSLAGKINSFTK